MPRLNERESAVLAILQDSTGRVVGRAELARRAGLSDLSTRRVDALIVGVRRALGPDAVITVRGRGWMLAQRGG